mmetsp:Transcript_17500/g.26976  ORF Transcript_17500/g.26976 Transcript_17500/m.26976 type:complete len:123 (+) Transcript_17500:19-387(+)
MDSNQEPVEPGTDIQAFDMLDDDFIEIPPDSSRSHNDRPPSEIDFRNYSTEDGEESKTDEEAKTDEAYSSRSPRLDTSDPVLRPRADSFSAELQDEKHEQPAPEELYTFEENMWDQLPEIEL